MARAEASCIIQSALARSQAVQAPVWPRIAPDQPVRHPARQRQPYRPRGVLHADSVALWGLQDAAIPQQAYVPAPPPAFRRNRLAVASVATAVAGTCLFALTTIEAPAPSVAPQAPVTAQPLRPALVVQPIAPVVPEARGAVAPSTIPAVPRVQDTAPILVAQAPLVGPAIAPRIAVPARPVSASPAIAAPAPATDAFQCAECTASPLRLDGITVTLQASTDAQARGAADAIAAMGAAAVSHRPSAISVATSQVRVYRAQDLATAQTLADRFGAALVDVTWLSDAAPARIDLLLAQDPVLPN